MPEPAEILQVNKVSSQDATCHRTKVGRERSSRNATKYGIFSEVVTLPGEPRQKYLLLLKELQDALQPLGRLEELIVEKLATLAWRHRRLLTAEGAEIRSGTELSDTTMNQSIGSWFASEPALVDQIGTPDVLDECLGMLRGLQEDIDRTGFHKDRDSEVFERVYGSHVPNVRLFQNYLEWAETAEVPEEEGRREGYASADQCKANVVREIDEEIRRLREDGANRILRSAKRAKLEILRHSIPTPKGLDRLLRYEASLERSFDRALNQLERMQRLRRGQVTAPRIDVTVF